MPNDIANNMVDTIHELEKELKETQNLLKEAVSSLYFNFHYASKAEIRLCYCDKCMNDSSCSKDIDKCIDNCKFVWWKRDEYLKLLKL